MVGACLSISSTLVVIKSLIDRGEIDSLHGRAAIGWSIVQDIATIVFIVALPPLAGGDLVAPFALALVKARDRSSPSPTSSGRGCCRGCSATVARLGSRELFLLAVFATALLTAFVSSAVFGLSLALGAFVGGLARLGVGPVAPGGGRGHPVPRPVRRAVLRVGRDARSTRRRCVADAPAGRRARR